MKNNKKLVIILILSLLILVVAIITYRYLSNHIFNKSLNAKEELTQKILSIEDAELRQNVIEHFLETNVLTQSDANSLY